MQVSKIFQNAVNKGGEILSNGNVYVCQKSKHYPNRYIQKVIEPTGNYTIKVRENNSTLTDSWDFSKKRGIHLSSANLNDGKSILSRVFDKVGELKINQDGFIYLHHFGKPETYMTEVKTLNGITSTPKPFSQFAWLNNEFYKHFNIQA